jgi:hypothetical protein
MKTNKKLKSDNNVKKVEQEVPLSFAQLEGKCYCCRKPGHKLPHVARRIQNHMRSGLFIRPKAICRHLGMPTLPVKAATSQTTLNPTKAHRPEESDGPPTVLSSRCYAWMHSTGQLFQYNDLE